MKALFVLLCGAASLFAGDFRLGIIGTDTSHAVAFAQALNDPMAKGHVPGAKVVAAYKGGSPDVESSRTRVDRYAGELQTKWKVQMVDSIPELCKLVDGVLLESVDGRVHLAQAREVIAAGKPLFIDKPLASTLADAREIARLAKAGGVPWFSASSLRFGGVAELKKSPVEGAITWGPGPLEPHHQLDLSWYAVHAIEMLYALMGEGCQDVTRVSSPDADVIVGRWNGGRVGTVRALRPYGKFGAVVFRKGEKAQTFEVFEEADAGYAPLVDEIVKFFDTRQPPVPNSETLEMFAFMDAAQRSKETGGKPAALR